MKPARASWNVGAWRRGGRPRVPCGAALALAEGAASAEQVWDAVTLDEEYQAERWGRDPLAAAGIEARRRDFDAGVRFLALGQAADEADHPTLA